MASAPPLRAEFRAALPAIQSAIKSDGASVRVQLDIPESEVNESVKLMLMKGRRLHVVIETEDDDAS